MKAQVAVARSAQALVLKEKIIDIIDQSENLAANSHEYANQGHPKRRSQA